MKDMFSSRKFKAALVAAGVAFAASLFGVSEAQVLVIVSPLLTFIGAQGWADAAAGKGKPALPPSEK